MKNKKGSTPKSPSPKPVSDTTDVRFKWHGWIVFIFGALLYINTIGHDYTQDDAIVIYDNMYTTQGMSGIKGLFTKDTFFGFFKEEGKAKLVSGGRYRPFTPVMFAVEYAIVGKQPWLGHAMNILTYGFLCFAVYYMLVLLLCYKDDTAAKRYLALAAALIFAAHPIHTEAVANIKGRDEIMAMLASIIALMGVVKYTDTKAMKYLVIAAMAFFVGLLSKENTITFLAVVPLALYYFRDSSMKSALLSSAILIVPTILFLMIRSAILGNDFGGTPMELMNNPYLKIVDGAYVSFTGGEKMATILYTLGKYVQLLVFPHPLTHDYYPRHIDIMSFGDVGVIGSGLLYAGLVFLSIWGLKTRNIIGFGAAYFLITLSIVSNIVFPIGTNMSERFMFMPSLGFAIVVGFLLQKFVFARWGQQAAYISLGVLLSLYAIKTVTRNQVWVNDFTLFTTDVKTSTRSAKILNAAGGALTTEAFNEKDEDKRAEMCREALGYLNKAIEIHPNYKNAYLIMGNAHYYLREFEPAIAAYEKALRLDPDFDEPAKNMAIALRDGARIAGEVEGDLAKCEQMLLRSLSLNGDDTETLRLLGVMNGIKGNHTEAIKYFEKVTQLQPSTATAYLNLGTAYNNAGDKAKGELNMQKALQLDPNVLNTQGQ